ncbi:MAG: acyl-CoA dehydrogenase family protein, partial [Halioglobus sp.]|nr:acyl-CoA dehydrogenase family protein [Halioglobus sp.]
MLISLFWFLLFFGGGIYLAYNRVKLLTSTVAVAAAVFAYTVFGSGHPLWVLLLWLPVAVLVVLNMEEFRREKLTKPALAIYRTMLPSMSDTEREALEAGNVWWDGELFSGMPDWSRLMSFPAPKLSDDEQAFMDGPCETLCRMLDDWDIAHNRADMPEEVWAFIKKHRFFAMIIPKQYGGLGFSAYANAMVISKLASRSATASSTVGVPNSLGPAELLLHYGTPEQKQHYLPRLATGEEIPAFALTSPWAGSDAASIPDAGVVCKGEWQGEEVLGMRVTFDKRYITLAPVCTVFGLAFHLYDPDRLLGGDEVLGITCALIPHDHPGVDIGRRHFPLNAVWMNGPVRGKDVFVPLEFIIGGPKMAGQGW